MEIAIIGAGSMGSALGLRLAEAGEQVVFGVRNQSEAGELVEKGQGRVRVASVPEACRTADPIVLAVPAKAAVEALRGCELDGKVVVDGTNPVGWQDGPLWQPPAAGSVTAELARAYPQARWLKGFSTFGAEIHRDPRLASGAADLPLAGDDAGAKERVAEIARRAGFQPFDAGLLRNAALLESLAVLWIHLAAVGGQGREWAFQRTGRG